MSDPAWSLADVTLAGRGQPRLANLSLQIPTGMTAVLGASGAGKSSLLGLLTEFESPTSGAITFHKTASKDRLPLFWSPQDHGLWPHLSVAEHIEQVRPSAPTINRTTEQWLALFGLAELKDARPDLLSQGERSRLSLARTLASEASAIVLDEPMVHVDPMLAHECWRIIAEHVEQHCTAAVFSTHDPDSVLQYADHAICLREGAADFCGPVHQLYFEPPTRELAWLLGPCNWFGTENSQQDTSLGLRHRPSDNSPACIRPAELSVIADSASSYVIESQSHAASFMTFRLRHHGSESPLTVITAPTVRTLTPGDAVRLNFSPLAERNGAPRATS